MGEHKRGRTSPVSRAACQFSCKSLKGKSIGWTIGTSNIGLHHSITERKGGDRRRPKRNKPSTKKSDEKQQRGKTEKKRNFQGENGREQRGQEPRKEDICNLHIERNHDCEEKVREKERDGGNDPGLLLLLTGHPCTWDRRAHCYHLLPHSVEREHGSDHAHS